MKTPRRRQLRRCALATVTLLAVSSCNEDQTAEVEKLTEELGIARENYESQRALVERRDEEIDKAYQQVSDLKSELRSAEKDLRRAENELERFRRKEEAAMKAAEKPDVRQMRVAIEMIDAFRVQRRRAALGAVHLVAFLQEQFSQIAAVLAGDPGDQGPGHASMLDPRDGRAART